MANTYPLSQPVQTAYQGKSPSAVTDQADAYRKMLGTQAAGEDVGLFYQLNLAAGGATDEAIRQGQTVGGMTPIEANSAYA